MMKIIFLSLGFMFLFYILEKSYWVMVGALMVLLFSMIMYLGLGIEEGVSKMMFMYADNLSYSLIILSAWISFLMYLSSYKIYNSMAFSMSVFTLSVYILMLILVMTFLTNNLLSFYLFFEISLIPTLLIIMGWGYQPERFQAGVYFLFYTLTASLPLLVGLLWLYNTTGSLNVMLMMKSKINFFFFLIFLVAFLVKMPVFMVHLWLPKAHVEAPVAGSMILAGVLLKLGGFGLYRVIPFCYAGLAKWGMYFFGLSIMGLMYVGFICCRLNDLKALVAYSSVAHMGMVICGFMSFYYSGYIGCLIMMLAHGLSSSGLFCSVNLYYERLGSRSFFLNKGVMMFLPLFTLFYFMLCVSNIGAPPTMNLVSEIYLMASMLKAEKLMMLIFPLGSYLGAVFTLFLFSYSQHGRNYKSFMTYSLSNIREFHLFVIHLLPLNLMVLNFDYFTMLH